jgi:2-oxoisovalerate dehydrogenase E1 component
MLGLYETMVLSRALEQRLVELRRSGDLPMEVYPGVGQEAAMVGFAAALDGGDVFGGTHRDLGALLARGVTVEEVALNSFGKASGPTRGREPFFGIPAKGVLPMPPSAPATVAAAVGAALAFQTRGELRVAMAQSGEGATAAGPWHEAVNFAAIHGLPVVFAVQNNQFAGATPTDGSFALAYAAHRSDGYGIPGVVVDGNDVLECYAAARDAVERARAGEGPTLIEAVTFRRLGDTAGDDAGYVDPAERRSWEDRDPLMRFEEYLGTRGMLDGPRREVIVERAAAQVDKAVEWAAAQADPAPPAAPFDLFAPSHEHDGDLPPDAPGELTVAEALAASLAREMRRDDTVVVLGRDASSGGRHGITAGLTERLGASRVVDVPVAPAATLGVAVGMAVEGLRPVVETHGADDLYPALAALVGQAARFHWAAGVPVPLVVRVPWHEGAGPSAAVGPESLTALHPGVTVVAPATAAAALGLLAGAIRDDNPVVMVEHTDLYGTPGAVPEGDYAIAPGRAQVVRTGEDATVVAWGITVPAALGAAAALDQEGISIEVVDLMTLTPLDWDTVVGSVGRTSRLVVAQPSAPFGGIGAEIAARAAAEMMWDLDGPILRVGPPVTHVPPAGHGHAATDAVVEAVRSLART